MRTLLVVLLIPVLSVSALGSETPADGIAKLVTPLIEGEVVHGMAIGILQDGKTRRLAYGKLPAGADSVFEIGSITKVFTGWLLADLVRDGTVRLDQPVRELLPEGTVVPKHGEREITLLDLATHRSGLPRMPSNFAPPTVRKPVKIDGKLLDAYVGRYRYSPEVVFTVSRDERGLLVQMPDQPKRRLYALSATRFFVRVAPVALEFERDDEGRVTGVLMSQGARKVRAPKVE